MIITSHLLPFKSFPGGAQVRINFIRQPLRDIMRSTIGGKGEVEGSGGEDERFSRANCWNVPSDRHFWRRVNVWSMLVSSQKQDRCFCLRLLKEHDGVSCHEPVSIFPRRGWCFGKAIAVRVPAMGCFERNTDCMGCRPYS